MNWRGLEGCLHLPSGGKSSVHQTRPPHPSNNSSSELSPNPRYPSATRKRGHEVLVLHGTRWLDRDPSATLRQTRIALSVAEPEHEFTQPQLPRQKNAALSKWHRPNGHGLRITRFDQGLHRGVPGCAGVLKSRLHVQQHAGVVQPGCCQETGLAVHSVGQTSDTLEGGRNEQSAWAQIVPFRPPERFVTTRSGDSEGATVSLLDGNVTPRRLHFNQHQLPWSNRSAVDLVLALVGQDVVTAGLGLWAVSDHSVDPMELRQPTVQSCFISGIESDPGIPAPEETKHTKGPFIQVSRTHLPRDFVGVSRVPLAIPCTMQSERHPRP